MENEQSGFNGLCDTINKGIGMLAILCAVGFFLYVAFWVVLAVGVVGYNLHEGKTWNGDDTPAQVAANRAKEATEAANAETAWRIANPELQNWVGSNATVGTFTPPLFFSPRVSESRLAGLRSNERIRVLAKCGKSDLFGGPEWYQIKTYDGKIGFVSAQTVYLDDEVRVGTLPSAPISVLGNHRSTTLSLPTPELPTRATADAEFEKLATENCKVFGKSSGSVALYDDLGRPVFCK